MRDAEAVADAIIAAIDEYDQTAVELLQILIGLKTEGSIDGAVGIDILFAAMRYLNGEIARSVMVSQIRASLLT